MSKPNKNESKKSSRVVLMEKYISQLNNNFDKKETMALIHALIKKYMNKSSENKNNTALQLHTLYNTIPQEYKKLNLKHNGGKHKKTKKHTRKHKKHTRKHKKHTRKH